MGILYLNHILAPSYTRANLYPIGFMAGEITGRDANPMIDQDASMDENFCVEEPGSFTWRS